MSTREHSGPAAPARPTPPTTTAPMTPEEPVMLMHEHALAQSRMQEMREAALATSRAHRTGPVGPGPISP